MLLFHPSKRIGRDPGPCMPILEPQVPNAKRKEGEWEHHIPREVSGLPRKAQRVCLLCPCPDRQLGSLGPDSLPGTMLDQPRGGLEDSLLGAVAKQPSRRTVKNKKPGTSRLGGVAETDPVLELLHWGVTGS